MADSPLVKLKTFGAKPINKDAHSILSRRNKPTKKEKEVLNQKIKLRGRKCKICNIYFHESINDHISSEKHKLIRMKNIGLI
ncbi:hypothetical protein [Polynucleobacter kasalickyi]|uniref:Uncharacterized protein n=1 Tax=Polynucleobacter kasalickyi TaxID=1938817 RepID=A0A1W2BLJ5_9BURK|nr:hypothetical protein [Polynucleobacter kasalickyi]SMC73643.1 hypothetical protein SAMN06296008_1142 [Polynucleobacter kasalickyi]